MENQTICRMESLEEILAKTETIAKSAQDDSVIQEIALAKCKQLKSRIFRRDWLREVRKARAK